MCKKQFWNILKKTQRSNQDVASFSWKTITEVTKIIARHSRLLLLSCWLANLSHSFTEDYYNRVCVCKGVKVRKLYVNISSRETYTCIYS